MTTDQTKPDLIADGVDAEVFTANQRQPIGHMALIAATLCVLYSGFHIAVMNLYPLEPWTYRLIHVGGGLALAFLLYSSSTYAKTPTEQQAMANKSYLLLLAPGAIAVTLAFVQAAAFFITDLGVDQAAGKTAMVASYGYPLIGGIVWLLVMGWFVPGRDRARIDPTDAFLALAAITVALYIIYHAPFLRLRAGTGLAKDADMLTSIAGVILILEVTRRLAGLALVIIAGVFILYSFVGPWLPGVLQHKGYSASRFFTYIYTDQGILGPTTAISSTYIILFVAFAAFLQASRVGEYFVNFAFAAAGGQRGGPAKVAVFGSGLMGMINGTSAGNVVATGSLTIPLMKRVGYKPQTAAAVEAAASSGGQILPPIMGAGAFIMSEITGIAYSEIVIAAIIPALLYFASVFFNVDLYAQKYGMKGLPRNELPQFSKLAKQVYLFLPIIILIAALFMGYSVIRAGTLAMAAAAVVSWLTPYKMGPKAILFALEIATKMSLQLVAVCAAAGIIVGVIALTGVGTRFSSLLLGLADQNQMVALFFAMIVSIVLGMGMPTTAAYAVAASVIAPGLIQMGIEPLTAHFFIFYFAVMSAITPPVALAAYAGAAIAQSDPMKTSVESFKMGLAAFVVPFMFFTSPALLMQGTWLEILHVVATAGLGIFLLSSTVQGWFFGQLSTVLRVVLMVAALSMIEGSWFTDVIGFGVAVAVWAWQKKYVTPTTLAHGSD
ncbi:TRAP transporter, 4TM/12TM fusion protein [Pseudorhodobacter antarcticus]|jgi:TRAP transporter 4TM/12TM fusion protein|uniref:TRAP transporter, 4TM/12TM fusion protein n=1 Tax=Pseudorhodobacter antarcticus TaxID=1077947 RepID=A0A1H8MZG0_9RHOB|nr:TRAP transporter permease [Pseudorhodobacter antarcticus]SEO22656.1 TRAP transporter, 4TM/12TM fusion protein [Pseudorhodobacter antarcticus]